MKIYKNTTHKAIVGDSRKKHIKDETVDLVVTSPPYPMIKMWDEIFCLMNPKIDIESNPNLAFKLMNNEMAKVYKQMYKSLKPGGIMVINIGDATRTVNGNFKLYTNGAKTIEICEKIGFDTLPQIHWWKPTNSPNKFMGSGMYPVGAYVTLETEHILIFRKGRKVFKKAEDKKERQISAFFQNERNLWFTDIWKNVYGASQKISGLSRERNGAFPEELPFRIINMFSVKGDVVVDPFGGTGTTSLAAMRSGRSSIIFDIDETFVDHSLKLMVSQDIDKLNKKNKNRIKVSSIEVKEKLKKKDIKAKYKSVYGDVYTRQEQKIIIPIIKSIFKNNNLIEVEYE